MGLENGMSTPGGLAGWVLQLFLAILAKVRRKACILGEVGGCFVSLLSGRRSQEPKCEHWMGRKC